MRAAPTFTHKTPACKMPVQEITNQLEAIVVPVVFPSFAFRLEKQLTRWNRDAVTTDNPLERPAVETGCTCMFKLQATQMEACHSLIDLF